MHNQCKQASNLWKSPRTRFIKEVQPVKEPLPDYLELAYPTTISSPKGNKVELPSLLDENYVQTNSFRYSLDRIHNNVDSEEKCNEPTSQR